MSTIIPSITSDPDFVMFLADTLPESRTVLQAYVLTPTCSSCIEKLGKLDRELESMHDQLVADFTAKVGRPPRAIQQSGIKALLIGDFTVQPANYREFIREMARQYRWNAMKTTAQKDGSWLLEFS